MSIKNTRISILLLSLLASCGSTDGELELITFRGRVSVYDPNTDSKGWIPLPKGDLSIGPARRAAPVNNGYYEIEVPLLETSLDYSQGYLQITCLLCPSYEFKALEYYSGYDYDISKVTYKERDRNLWEADLHVARVSYLDIYVTNNNLDSVFMRLVNESNTFRERDFKFYSEDHFTGRGFSFDEYISEYKLPYDPYPTYQLEVRKFQAGVETAEQLQVELGLGYIEAISVD